LRKKLVTASHQKFDEEKLLKITKNLRSYYNYFRPVGGNYCNCASDERFIAFLTNSTVI